MKKLKEVRNRDKNLLLRKLSKLKLQMYSWPYLLNIFILLSFGPLKSSCHTSKCLNAGWIPYKSEKCIKILNIYETHPSAISECQKQLIFDDLIDTNLQGELLTIGSKDEEEFIEGILFNISRYTDNVWLGAVRDGTKAQFKWLDGTSLNNHSIYTKWAYSNPTGDFNKNCVELRAKDLPNPNPSSPGPTSGPGQAPNPNPSVKGGSFWSSNPPSPSASPNFPSDPNAGSFFEQGTWYNVPCSKHNLVVCQITQLVPEQILQFEVVKAKKEIVKLKQDLGELRRLIGELASHVVTDIRFGSKESTSVWQAPGFPDGKGYVITGVENWDQNCAVDTVSRRNVQKFVNGQWLNVY